MLALYKNPAGFASLVNALEIAKKWMTMISFFVEGLVIKLDRIFTSMEVLEKIQGYDVNTGTI